MSRYNDSTRPGYGGGYGGSYGAGYGSSYNGGYGENNSADNKYYGNGSGNDDASAAPSNPPSLRQPSNRTRRAGQYGTNPYGGVGGAGGAGYDGHVDASSASDTPGARQLPRPTSLERSQAKRRSGGASAGGWGQHRSPTRRRDADGYGDGSRAVEEVLRQIRADWAFMTDEKCVPVQVALQFMDNSSLGLANRYNRFKQLHAQLQVALKQIVNEQHQGFNSSIGRFHSIQAALQTGQTRLRTLRESLGSAQGSFTTAKPELRGLADASQNYDDMLMTLSAIEHLQGIPEKLEAKLSEKRFLTAVELLQDGLTEIRKPSMDGIGALSDLKVYLSNQEQSLTDILIEELHNHLYLKSPYCENRWKEHASQQVRGVNRESAVPMGARQLYQFLDQLDTDTIATDDPTKNPETDTYSYIHLLVESLNSLGRLEMAVETIAQRLPLELFKVVEKCSNEVDQRYPAGFRARKGFSNAIDFNDAGRAMILNDLFGTLYARFEAIAEGHRVVHEVISGITKREGTRGSSALTGGFRELWKLYQSEIRSLLHDYLSTNEDAFKMRENGAGSVFQKNSRDKTKKMFKLQDMDSKSADLTNEREDLQAILTISVPGLVSDLKRTDSSEPAISNAVDGSATGHRLLADPSVFNMAILLPPSLVFLNRLKEVVPPSADIAMSTLTSFLDDFLINVFLPQLDETLVEMSSQIFIETDAFQQDPNWQNHSKRPIFKGAAKFYGLIEAFCRMLDTLPHDQAFSQLIITQIVTYYDKCYGWYKATVSRTQAHPQTGKRMKMSAALLDSGDLNTIVEELRTSDVAKRPGIIAKEHANLLSSLEGALVEDQDLVLDRRNIAGLCLLLTSMKWFAVKVQGLRFISSQNEDSSKRNSERYDKQRRWTLITAHQEDDPDRVYLPLTEETASAFDGVQNSYLLLSTSVLRALHVEMRMHVFHFISRSMRRNFQLDQELNEADPEIVALNADLAGFDEELATHLQDVQQSFITTGLASLIDEQIIGSAPHIPVLNAAGCNLLQLNVLVLQHNLKNIEPQVQLLRSTLYFDLYAGGPNNVIAHAKTKSKSVGFSFEQMKVLLQLCYSEALKSDQQDVSAAAEKGLEEHMQQLSQAMGLDFR